jgi:hypothetical protein
MKLTFEIYLKALGFYALLTAPALVLFFMYFISLFYVLLFGLAAWLVFAALFISVASLQINTTLKWFIISIAVPLGVAAGHTLIGVFRFERNVWELNGFLLFPLAAVIAGWISLYISRNKIADLFPVSADDTMPFEEVNNFIE